MAGFNLICCVVNFGNASKTLKIAKNYGVTGGTIFIGRGTVSNRLLGYFGFDEVRKEIVYMVVKDGLTSEAIKGISEGMAFHKPNRGIAFTISVADFVGSVDGTEKNIQAGEVKNGMYSAIYVVVDKGKAEEVIDAANKAGARGGTIFNARGSGIHETQKLFSIEIEPEKEVVFIIAKTESKDSIAESIKTHLKIEEPGKGVMFILDVDEVYGLR